MKQTNIAEIKHHGFKKEIEPGAYIELVIERSNDDFYYHFNNVKNYFIKYDGFQAEPLGDMKIKLLDGTSIKIYSTKKIAEGMAIVDIAIEFPMSISKIMASDMSPSMKAVALDLNFELLKRRFRLMASVPINKKPEFIGGEVVPLNKKSELIISPVMGEYALKVLKEIKIDLKDINDAESKEEN